MVEANDICIDIIINALIGSAAQIAVVANQMVFLSNLDSGAVILCRSNFICDGFEIFPAVTINVILNGNTG